MTRHPLTLLATALCLLVLAACGPRHETGTPQPRLAVEPLSIETAGGKTIELQVEIADTEPKRQAGLMFRPPVPKGEGMLFIFDQPAERSFWMKNTPEPLDILYISAGGRIISIARKTKPWSEEPIPSHGPALGALEIAGGRSAELGVAEGDRVRHRIFP